MKRMFQTLALAIASAAVLSAAPAPQTAPDNTKVNKAEAPTAQDQNNGKGDIETARQVRKAIVGDKSLSTYAHNVKVIARNGQVTLKGPVRTADEKAAVEAKAAGVVGAGKVVNEIEVAPSKTAKK
jgi:hyperosmotically inducible periplasmic protein